jgi:hypothetical protein
MKKQKKERQPFEDFVMKNVKAMKEALGIGAITVQLVKSDNKSQIQTRKPGGNIPFAINYCPVYKRATIWYYPIAIETYNNGREDILIQGITHEVSHILTEKLASLAVNRFAGEKELDDEVETLTETIAQIGRKLLAQKMV